MDDVLPGALGPARATGTAAPGATVTARRPRRRPVFHPLRVASVERLCEDAAAIGFEVPEELTGDFAFEPGQSLTLRRRVDGRDERRSYSLCAPAGARRASRCARCPGDCSPPGWSTRCGPATRSR